MCSIFFPNKHVHYYIENGDEMPTRRKKLINIVVIGARGATTSIAKELHGGER